MTKQKNLTQFKKTVWSYYKEHGRSLPWRNTRNPYHILVSEIMLQQTQVNRVLVFYPLFLNQFPTLQAFAKAKTARVLETWQGLGYNRRALNLQKLAKQVIRRSKGKLPNTCEELLELPGVGPATAGAIMSYAWNKPSVFIETNIRRVYIHHFFPKHTSVSDKEILELVQKTVDQKNPREWYWALMDYGTHLGSRTLNPNRRSKHYARQSTFTGSNREIRGKILRFIIKNKRSSVDALMKALETPRLRLETIIQNLAREGFVTYTNNSISIS